MNERKSCVLAHRWSVITLTTVGYGDMVPVTDLGFVVGAVCAISGTVLFALTIPVLSNNFAVLYSHAKSRERAAHGQSLLSQLTVNIRRRTYHFVVVYHVLKNSQNCFCHNFVKFPPTLIIFGTKMAKMMKLCKVHSFSTLRNLCR